MTDEWDKERLPYFLRDRSLLSAANSKPMFIGNARVAREDLDSMVGISYGIDSIVDFDSGDYEKKVKKEMKKEYNLKARYDVTSDSEWLGELIDDLPYQVTYYFPSIKRDNKVGKGTYGSKQMTFRVLYDFLCTNFNGGRRFIDEYFLTVFEQRMKPAYDKAISDLKAELREELINSDGGVLENISQRLLKKRRSKKLSEYNAWANPRITQTLNSLARKTKNDIITCLRTGKINLVKETLSARTVQKRMKLGLPIHSIFYATGRLIKSIKVTVLIVGNEERVEHG